MSWLFCHSWKPHRPLPTGSLSCLLQNLLLLIGSFLSPFCSLYSSLSFLPPPPLSVATVILQNKETLDAFCCNSSFSTLFSWDSVSHCTRSLFFLPARLDSELLRFRFTCLYPTVLGLQAQNCAWPLRRDAAHSNTASHACLTSSPIPEHLSGLFPHWRTCWGALPSFFPFPFIPPLLLTPGSGLSSYANPCLIRLVQIFAIFCGFHDKGVSDSLIQP